MNAPIAGPTDQDVREVMGWVELLCDSTRLRILAALRDRPMYVGELCRLLDQAQPPMSHHLALLRAAHLVLPRRDGKRVYYETDRDALVRSARACLALLGIAPRDL